MRYNEDMNIKDNEGVRVQEAKLCLLCGTEGFVLYKDQRDRLFDAPGIWNIMLCPQCHFVWFNPCPIPQDIGKLYKSYFTHDSNSLGQTRSIKKMIRNAVLVSSFGYSNIMSSMWQNVLGKILSWIGPIKEIIEMGVMTLDGKRRGKLLDVGCGNGWFLSEMRDLGWEVVGVEPDGEAVRVARERFGLNVYEGTLEEVGFSDDNFDAITMNHVVEHLWDPVSTLRECRRVLKPGGKLVVVTPNIKSLGHRLFKKAWLHLDPPRHLYLFSLHTLKVCAEQAGLKILKLRTTARSARWIWVASHLIRKNGTLPGGSPGNVSWHLQLVGLLFQAIEYGLCQLKDAGEEIVLIATK